MNGLEKKMTLLTIGITDHAQTMLGDLVYVELPEIETNFDGGQECAVVESVKAAADIYCPVQVKSLKSMKLSLKIHN